MQTETAPESLPSRPRRWLQAVVFAIWACLMTYATVKGLEFRKFAWDYTQDVHFETDIQNAYTWGTDANNVGVFNVYHYFEEGARHPDGRRLLLGQKLDYPPLRLYAVYRWVKWAKAAFPDRARWENTYDMSYPMLRFNTICEFVSTWLVFAIVLLWRRRTRAGPGPVYEAVPWYVGLLPATVGAMLFWFNPNVVWVSHVWPQWDVWLIPFFLAAILFASLNWWISAGICLAIGACLKGQTMMAAPIFLLWPLFQGRINATLRLIAGFALGMAVIVLPWMQPSGAALRWGMLMLMACAVTSLAMWLATRPNWPKWIWLVTLALVLGAGAMAFPWTSGAVVSIRLIPVGIIALWVLASLLPTRWAPPVATACAAGIVFLMIPLFGAFTSWYTTGFVFGADKFAFMLAGNGSYNLPMLLQTYTTEKIEPREVLFTISWLDNKEVNWHGLSRILSIIPLILCGVGIALQDRRKNGMALVPIIATWVWSFLVLTQMHGRYHIWQAGIGAILMGASTGMALLGVVLTIIGWAGVAYNQLYYFKEWTPDLYRQLEQIGPHLGWVVLLIGLIFIYSPLVHDRRVSTSQRRALEIAPPQS